MEHISNADIVKKTYATEEFIIRDNQDLYFPPSNQRNFAISIPRRQQRFRRNGHLRNQLHGISLPIVSRAISPNFTGANLIFGQYDAETNVFTICQPDEATDNIVVVPYDLLKSATIRTNKPNDGLKDIREHAIRYHINDGVGQRSYFILELGERLVSDQTVADVKYRCHMARSEYQKLLEGKPLTNPTLALQENYANDMTAGKNNAYYGRGYAKTLDKILT